MDQRINIIQEDMTTVHIPCENAHTLMPVTIGNAVEPASFPVDMGGI